MRKALEHLRTADARLAAVIEAVGPYRIRYNEPEFGSLVRSIVYQQLSGMVASVIFGRLTAWQNWIFNRPNAVGERGALKVYGTGEKVSFDQNRV